jgi:hypothetical protein
MLIWKLLKGDHTSDKGSVLKQPGKAIGKDLLRVGHLIGISASIRKK